MICTIHLVVKQILHNWRFDMSEMPDDIKSKYNKEQSNLKRNKQNTENNNTQITHANKSKHQHWTRGHLQ